MTSPKTRPVGAAPKQLPALRGELDIIKGRPQISGAPSWLIFDPVRHAYFEIDQTTFELLSCWDTEHIGAFFDCAKRRLGREVGNEELTALLQFLYANSLTTAPVTGSYTAYLEQANAGQTSWWQWLVHNYLFVRIPLVRPDGFLRRALPYVKLFFAPGFWWMTALIGVLSLMLVSRQWDTFLSSFLYFFSWQGVLAYGASLVVIKALHELGHAFTAVRYGCRVPTMGVAFLVLMPVFYTDVTDAWRLRSRRQRLLIDTAGIIVELGIAVFATLAWVFLPDGPLRSVAFVLATASWAMSLVINLNPFMRFDGYYILSDLIGFSNLQQRAFAFGRWQLREILFGLKQPAPEKVSDRMRKGLVAYAWATWLYRLVLFIGIALLVYHLFFKLLGILLFVIEIIWFIARPVAGELREWWHMRTAIKSSPRTWLTAAVLALLITVLTVPWVGRITVPALLVAAGETPIHTVTSARLRSIAVKEGEQVEKGQVLFQLHSPRLDHDIKLAEIRLRLIKARLDRIAGDAKDRGLRLVLEGERHAIEEKLRGLQAERQELTIRAPIAGTVRDINRLLAPGQWVPVELQLASILPDDTLELRGLLAESDLRRVSPHLQGRFIPDDPARPSFEVKLIHIADTASDKIRLEELTSAHGGPIAVRQAPAPDSGLKSEDARYRVQMRPLTPASTTPSDSVIAQSVRGLVHLQGAPESLLSRALAQVMKVIIREAGL